MSRVAGLVAGSISVPAQSDSICVRRCAAESEVGLSTCYCSATVTRRFDRSMATGEITGSFRGAVSP